MGSNNTSVWAEPDDGPSEKGWVSMVEPDGTTNHTWAVEMYAQIERVLGERGSTQ
jgi:hypothetical protein